MRKISFADLKKTRDKKNKWGIKPSKPFVLSARQINSEEKNLAEYCDKCNTITSHSRIKYEVTKSAKRCLSCRKLTKIGTR